MQAVILAAGRGERLWPLTRNTPKCLLEIVNSMSLLDMQMEALGAVPEIHQVVYVLGYLAEQIETKLMHYADHRLEVCTVYNPFFADANNLVSLWLALPYLQDDFMVINGDDVYDSSVPQGLVAVNPDKDVVMTVDRKEKYDDDDMKVTIKGDRVLKVGKDIPLDEANGESIGMIRFGGAGACRFRETLDRIVRLPSGRQVFWLNAVQRLIDRGYMVHWYECSPDSWAEIDFHPDLQLVRNAVIDNYAEITQRWSQSR